jgi:site-specific DNA-methyltransferase (adenine-specific)
VNAPYYADEDVTLYLGDCREVLPALGITADCIVADPPYGETSLAWDRWPDGWLDVAATVTRSLWCFGSLRMYLEHAAEFAAWKLSQDIIWEKQNGSGLHDDRFRRVHEQPTHWYQGQWRDVYHKAPREAFSGDRADHLAVRDKPSHMGPHLIKGYTDDGTRLMPSVIRIANLWKRGGIHPTQKPGGLLEPLIAYACPPGGLIVDPFAGSASSLVIARMTGRRGIGVELHEPQAEKAAKWLCQGDLFGGAA